MNILADYYSYIQAKEFEQVWETSNFPKCVLFTNRASWLNPFNNYLVNIVSKSCGEGPQQLLMRRQIAIDSLSLYRHYYYDHVCQIVQRVLIIFIRWHVFLQNNLNMFILLHYLLRYTPHLFLSINQCHLLPTIIITIEIPY